MRDKYYLEAAEYNVNNKSINFKDKESKKKRKHTKTNKLTKTQYFHPNWTVDPSERAGEHHLLASSLSS